MNVHPEYANAATRYRPGLAELVAELESYNKVSSGLIAGPMGVTPKPALPVVDLSDADRAEMESVDVRLLRHESVRNHPDAGSATWEELFLAWRTHSRTHFNCFWKQVDGSALLYSHVLSALHIQRTHVIGIQASKQLIAV